MISPELKKKIDQAHREKKQVVLVTGVFDILHQEHTNFLQKAKQLGGILVVGIESDERVRKMKGEGRPLHTLPIRIKNLEALQIADEVFGLPKDFSTPEHHNQLIAEVSPNFLAISSHSPHQVEKDQILRKHGGQLRIVHQHNPNVSTSQILRERENRS